MIDDDEALMANLTTVIRDAYPAHSHPRTEKQFGGQRSRFSRPILSRPILYSAAAVMALLVGSLIIAVHPGGNAQQEVLAGKRSSALASPSKSPTTSISDPSAGNASSPASNLSQSCLPSNGVGAATEYVGLTKPEALLKAKREGDDLILVGAGSHCQHIFGAIYLPRPVAIVFGASFSRAPYAPAPNATVVAAERLNPRARIITDPSASAS